MHATKGSPGLFLLLLINLIGFFAPACRYLHKVLFAGISLHHTTTSYRCCTLLTGSGEWGEVRICIVHTQYVRSRLVGYDQLCILASPSWQREPGKEKRKRLDATVKLSRGLVIRLHKKKTLVSEYSVGLKAIKKKKLANKIVTH